MGQKANQCLSGEGMEGVTDSQGAQETLGGYANICPLNVGFMSTYINIKTDQIAHLKYLEVTVFQLLLCSCVSNSWPFH